MKTIDQLREELAKTLDLCTYWDNRRHGQTGNCISDQEHQLDAQRTRQKLEYQIRQLENNEKIY